MLYRASKKEHFPSLLSTFPYCVLAGYWGWSDNAGCNVDTWFESKQCFIQVISWGSKSLHCCAFTGTGVLGYLLS